MSIAVDFSKLDCLFGQKYEEPLCAPVYVFSFQKNISASQLIRSRNLARPTIDSIEIPTTRQLFYSRMVSFFFIRKYFTAIVSGLSICPEDQFPRLLTRFRRPSYFCHRTSSMKRLCLPETTNLPIPQSNCSNMSISTCRWIDEYLKRLAVSGPICAASIIRLFRKLLRRSTHGICCPCTIACYLCRFI